ncbi:30S small subunit ribosomal protein S5 [Kwoniella heveanensis CBS 569]|uniref:30S small subunit ribosomal protein S5 n=1 Tax=Kwoniella heveanensis BCC8398 TaxID=1296120 RepID=A0A1B9GN63_9TREE|nr:30S small subunit ribosomal protein S5 [Kwoniella heveanensis BCC8398]OCF38293.1 30S small subunit ribosomal protein S5 [Kwoniella heveanensis CBS 569]
MSARSLALTRPFRALGGGASGSSSKRLMRAASTISPSEPSNSASSDVSPPSPPPPPPQSSTPREASESSFTSASTASSSSTSTPTPPPAPSGLPRPAFSIPFHPVPRLPQFPNTHSSPLHKHYNHPSPLFSPPSPAEYPTTLADQNPLRKEQKLSAVSGLSREELRGLSRFMVRGRKVQHMTKKGKMGVSQAYVVVGSPERGLVGLGRGRGHNNQAAADAAFHKAVLSMDYVNRYEGRTLWGEGKDLQGKWGAAKVHLRARPPGFGLMVPPMIHRIFTACGIKDASAMIVGSRNRPDVLKATIQVLHGGGNPSGFGTGIAGKKGPRENKGQGMKSKEEIERERGRYGVDVGRRS